MKALETKHTPGPWTVSHGATVLPSIGSTCTHEKICDLPTDMAGNEKDAEVKANATLIAEAGTVATETGRSPRQLADERKELLDILTVIVEANRDVLRMPNYILNQAEAAIEKASARPL